MLDFVSSFMHWLISVHARHYTENKINISIYLVTYLCHLCNYCLSFLIVMAEIAYYLIYFLLQLYERDKSIVISTITLQESLNASLVRKQTIFRMHYYNCSSKHSNYFSQSYSSSYYYTIWRCYFFLCVCKIAYRPLK